MSDRIASALFTLLVMFAVRLSAQSFSIDWFTIDGGGGTCAGGAFSLRGTVGQADASGALQSGDGRFVLHGGFWRGAVRARSRAQHVFYNHSAWDGNDPAANVLDDAAIAPDKAALLSGGSASFANYTSYLRGLNGVMVDIDGLEGLPTAGDFSFKAGNDNVPASWAAAPAPASVTVRPGAGVGGSDRVTLIWNGNNLDAVADPNEAVAKKWLEVTVRPTANTGLAAPHTFYFGNAVGEAGHSAADAKVDPTDELLARANPRNALNPAPLDFRFDYNRDKRVDPADELLARANPANALNALKLIALGGGGAGPASLEAHEIRVLLEPDASGGWRLRASGRPGQRYILEAADDLRAPVWRALGEAAAGFDGIAAWSVPPDSGAAHVFFRITSAASGEIFDR